MSGMSPIEEMPLTTHKHRYFKELFCNLQTRFQHVIIYGAGKHTVWLLESVRPVCRPGFIRAIIDDYPAKDRIANVPVVRPCDCAPHDDEAVLLSSDFFEDVLFEQAKKHFELKAEILRPYHDLRNEDRRDMSRNEVVSIPVEDKELVFCCLSKTCRSRARTFFEKEPETLAWIDSFPPRSVFWDIGANVGVYSMYAALRSHSVSSFEPAASNYFALNRNIALNNFQN